MRDMHSLLQQSFKQGKGVIILHQKTQIVV